MIMMISKLRTSYHHNASSGSVIECLGPNTSLTKSACFVLCNIISVVTVV